MQGALVMPDAHKQVSDVVISVRHYRKYPSYPLVRMSRKSASEECGWCAHRFSSTVNPNAASKIRRGDDGTNPRRELFCLMDFLVALGPIFAGGLHYRLCSIIFRKLVFFLASFFNLSGIRACLDGDISREEATTEGFYFEGCT